MKCPVCKIEIESIAEACPNCGFSELHVEFLSTADVTNWVDEVVIPYRRSWENERRNSDNAIELFREMRNRQRKQLRNVSNEKSVEFSPNDYSYQIENGMVTITGSIGEKERIVIPAIIEGYEVKRIQREAFYGNKYLREIILPETLEWIGDFSFKDSNLSKIVLPQSLKGIGMYAFCNTKIEELIIPALVKTIPAFMCEGCTFLQTVVCLGVEEIKTFAFGSCLLLCNVAFSDELKEIHKEAFCKCSALSDIFLPKKTRYDQTSFTECHPELQIFRY